LTPSPIHRVLSSMRKNGVKSLLMGGQACVLYGAAEFSRDIDLAISADPANLERLQSAVDELEAIVIAVPPFQRQYLEAGQAVHFRCQHRCHGQDARARGVPHPLGPPNHRGRHRRAIVARFGVGQKDSTRQGLANGLATCRSELLRQSTSSKPPAGGFLASGAAESGAAHRCGCETVVLCSV